MTAVRRAVIATALLATTALALPVAISAHAAESAVICSRGSDVTGFSPGLDPVTRKDQVVTHLDTGSLCSGATVPGLTSFVGAFSGASSNIYCGGPTGSDSLGSGVEILAWNDGSTSTWKFDGPSLDHSPSGTYVDFHGRITAGRYQGLKPSGRLPRQDAPPGGCETVPLESVRGTGEWEFTP
ncbi:hypothetical protein [Kitasatospora sp. NBC_01300]|uniref:hypothetical protein n=1 Tax=Kitasatospora sp. NBC_01300 TaxID=2903574 RepID=UPI002F913D78|nr:hypothetical protein OG556_37350 [Kitasatospora sp. NBC_01300]